MVPRKCWQSNELGSRELKIGRSSLEKSRTWGGLHQHLPVGAGTSPCVFLPYYVLTRAGGGHLISSLIGTGVPPPLPRLAKSKPGGKRGSVSAGEVGGGVNTCPRGHMDLRSRCPWARGSALLFFLMPLSGLDSGGQGGAWKLNLLLKLRGPPALGGGSSEPPFPQQSQLRLSRRRRTEPPTHLNWM